MSPEEQSAAETREAWELFSRFSDEELKNLLVMAGVVPEAERAYRLHQVLIIWFHGSVPSHVELAKLVVKGVTS